MDLQPRKTLFISPHTDDVELSAGATVSKFIKNKFDVYYLALTTTDNSYQLRNEADNSMEVLGIHPRNYVFKEFKDAYFPTQRNEILATLEHYRDKWQPNIVFCPSRDDLHQDHKTTALETLRAFKWSSDIILGYDVSWNMVTRYFKPTLYVEVSKEDLIRKMDAVKCYKSQMNKFYVQELSLEGRARYAGVQVGVEFAESFEIYRMVNKI